MCEALAELPPTPGTNILLPAARVYAIIPATFLIMFLSRRPLQLSHDIPQQLSPQFDSHSPWL